MYMYMYMYMYMWMYVRSSQCAPQYSLTVNSAELCVCAGNSDLAA